MKRLFLAVLFIIGATFIYAAPFGLKMGMTIKEIAEQCESEPSFVQDDIYLVTPIKKHPLFTYYAVYVSERTGLYQIRAISDSIKCNNYGTEIQNAFNNVKDRISKTYGSPKIIDKVDPSSVWKAPKYWFQALKDGARQLSAVWGERTELADNLAGVALDCAVDNSPFHYENTQLVLYYYFENASSVEGEQDSVF
ncbi:MAG: hypothetical protein IJZ71_07550 [Treponema sp.]|nr:hypothetical protein [Treponema sp.]